MLIHFKGFLAIARQPHHETLPLEHYLQERSHRRLIVHDQDADLGRCRSLVCLRCLALPPTLTVSNRLSEGLGLNPGDQDGSLSLAIPRSDQLVPRRTFSIGAVLMFLPPQVSVLCSCKSTAREKVSGNIFFANAIPSRHLLFCNSVGSNTPSTPLTTALDAFHGQGHTPCVP